MIAAARKGKREYVTNQQALAVALGLRNDRSIGMYRQRGMPGADAKGRYDVVKCREWVAANVQSRNGSSDLRGDLIQAELRKVEAQAEKLELANARERGEMGYTADFVQAANEMVLRIKTRLESFPSEVEMQLPADVRAAVKAELENLVYLLLKEMAGWQVTG